MAGIATGIHARIADLFARSCIALVTLFASIATGTAVFGIRLDIGAGAPTERGFAFFSRRVDDRAAYKIGLDF